MFVLPNLTYAYAALEPVLSADTLHTHHDKHHRTYVKKTNELAAQAGLAGRTLEEVVREAHAKGDKTLFNNAAQAWNHAFFWNSMTPQKAQPSGKLPAAIVQAFGNVDAFKDAFVEEGAAHFGSGWVWLVTGAEGLKVTSTPSRAGSSGNNSRDSPIATRRRRAVSRRSGCFRRLVRRDGSSSSK